LIPARATSATDLTAGNTACGGTCIDTRTDPHHCGYCDHGCPAPTGGAPECVNGLCTTGLCYAGELVCSSACVEESASRCGGCSATCNGFASQTGVALADIACSDGSCITRLNTRTRQSCAQLCQSLGLTCTSPSQALTLDWWSDGCVSPGNGGCTLSWQGGYRYDTPGCVNYFASLGGGSITCTAVVYDCNTVPSTSYYWSSVNGSFTSMNCYCSQEPRLSQAAEAPAQSAQRRDLETRLARVKGKGNKDRILPVPTGCVEALMTYARTRPHEAGPYFLIGRDHAGRSRPGPSRAWSTRSIPETELTPPRTAPHTGLDVSLRETRRRPLEGPRLLDDLGDGSS
jgi:hypothetical protein